MLNAAAGPVAPMPPRDPVATLVLAGGRVLDPASGHDATADVAIADSRVLAVGPDLAAANPGARVLDCTGLLVTPGMIDLHAHVMAGLGDVSRPTGPASIGVTTVVDLLDVVAMVTTGPARTIGRSDLLGTLAPDGWPTSACCASRTARPSSAMATRR